MLILLSISFSGAIQLGAYSPSGINHVQDLIAFQGTADDLPVQVNPFNEEKYVD